MGPKQSSPSNKNVISEVKESTISHPKFNNARYFTSQQKEFIQASFSVPSENDIKTWEANYKPFVKNESLMLPETYQFSKTQMCGSNGICKINYPNYPYLLLDEINDRLMQPGSERFQNNEVLYLLYTLLDAANIFHSKGKKVGDIQPENIFINQDGQAKVGCQYSWPNELPNYQKTIFEKQITYLSPQEMKDLHFGRLQADSSEIQVSESFSIGLTILDSVLISDSRDLYNLKTNRFDYNKLAQRIQTFRNINEYDEKIKSIIEGLCRSDPSQRLKCCEIYRWLRKYEKKIVNIQPFEFEEYPSFITQNNYKSQNIVPQNIVPQPIPQTYVSQQPMPPHIIQHASRNFDQNTPPPPPPQNNSILPLLHSTFHSNPPLMQQHFEQRPQSNIHDNEQPRSVPQQMFSEQPQRVIQENHQIVNQQTFVEQNQRIDQQNHPFVVPEGQQTVSRISQQTAAYQPPITSKNVIESQVQQSLSPIKGHKNEQFTTVLNKIQEKLAESRKNFPS